MKNQTRWMASWKDSSGRDRVYILHSSQSRLDARIDFHLRLLSQGEQIPHQYEFQAIEGKIPVPSATGRFALPALRKEKWSTLRVFRLIPSSPRMAAAL